MLLTDCYFLSLFSHGTLIKRKISLLKCHGCIPDSFSVSKNFLECVQASPNIYECVNKSVEGQEDDKTISFLRDLVLECYLQHMLDASEGEVKQILKTYFRISYKSLLLIHETVKILTEELKFPKDHVKGHGYLFNAHPRELRKMLENIPSLGGIPLRDFLYKHPVVAISNYKTFSQTLQLLKKAGISEESIIETPLVFTLSVENVQKGLALLKSGSVKPEIKALLSHPQMLRLVVHHDSVNQRLNYLKNFEQSSDLKPVTSLNLLCGSHRQFERYVSGVGGTNRGNDVVNYITKTLGSVSKTDGERGLVTPTSVRNSLKRHIHWRNVPLSEIQSCLEMLLKLGFSCKEIMFSLQIVLYSPSKVNAQLERLSQEDPLSSFDDTLKKSRIEEGSEGQSNVEAIQHDIFCIPSHLKKLALPLCLYFLEKDHHFSGDGIWFRQ
ncbi:hypothetical protein J437_LFUL016856 [Ladona fulva]|uniref:Uncharacterized protein n=1 Tax=Ladona fulva TaxID=123851 RepID=A0A8K0KL40_LADFU|nr:hypothetical protein J437_LFUL016856 [Ladona fulva]